MTYTAPRFVNNGDRVLIPWPAPDKPRQGLWVRVACAAGYHARVVNEAFDVDRWMRIDALLVEAP